MRQKNDDEHVSTWTCEYRKSFLKLHKVVQEGNQAKLRNRCLLLKKLIHYGLENLITMTKSALRQMSSNLTLPFGAEASRYDLINNVSNVMIHNNDDTVEDILALVEKEDACDEIV